MEFGHKNKLFVSESLTWYGKIVQAINKCGNLKIHWQKKMKIFLKTQLINIWWKLPNCMHVLEDIRALYNF